MTAAWQARLASTGATKPGNDQCQHMLQPSKGATGQIVSTQGILNSETTRPKAVMQSISVLAWTHLNPSTCLQASASHSDVQHKIRLQARVSPDAQDPGPRLQPAPAL